MRRIRIALIFAAIALPVSIVLGAVFYGRIAVFLMGESGGIDITYSRLTTRGLTEFRLEGMKAIERKRGMGISSSETVVKFSLGGPAGTKAAADFNLSDVQFVRPGAEKEASYNNIDGLIALPFTNLCRYDTVSGKMSATRDGFSVQDFVASGDTIRFSADGTLTHGNMIDADIAIYFDKELTGKIPAELTSVALKDEDGGWKSLVFKLEGDLSKPSIRVTGKLFRLNIGVK
ncbi:MAG: hypothetical protein V1682_07210 [Candidatus Omnitrophota bacterium]